MCHLKLGERFCCLKFDVFARKIEVDAGQEEAAVETILEELVLEIHESVGVKMHRLGVCEWEVKLWMASPGPANGAWRVVVENVTGHTCIVHVSAYTKHVYGHGT